MTAKLLSIFDRAPPYRSRPTQPAHVLKFPPSDAILVKRASDWMAKQRAEFERRCAEAQAKQAQAMTAPCDTEPHA